MKRIIQTLFLLLLSLCFIFPFSLSASSITPPQETDEKAVYLTFDDGPTPKVTEQILDVLKANDVKATFFIVGKEIKGREAILKRIYEEGHGIGLHTYSHNFKIIYKNPESFIMEMEKVKSTINETLGTHLDIKAIRFPGGSAGRLNTKFYNALCAKGYCIYDWNVDLQDGIKGTLPPSTFVKNAKKCQDGRMRRIILAHCNGNNKNTALALNDIITYYKQEGYIFKAIDHTTTPYFYRFKK